MEYLSVTLPKVKAPKVCQSCGQASDKTALWQEHDDRDLPTMTFLYLCDRCNKERDQFGEPLPVPRKKDSGLVEEHPRLYTYIANNAPVPGTMALCYLCTHRAELTCLAVPEGIAIKQEKSVMFIDYVDRRGRRTGEQVVTYSPPESCSARQVQDEGKIQNTSQ